MIRNWVPASMIRIYGFHDEYKGRLAAFEKRIYPFGGWQCGQSDELFPIKRAPTPILDLLIQSHLSSRMLEQ